ncbi:hypothetical protein [Actinobaculum sp. 313]|uniref:hypothetical protein n=1 Tax=Actinobaculum sp. 313 TaxID=2495645 RepID=UPI000F741FEC|nr:hypothetical protein [Actinobaculum sp. 313]
MRVVRVLAAVVVVLSGCQSGDSPASSSASSGSSAVTPTPFVSSSASDESERFVVDEVDEGLKVEWVSMDATDTSFDATYRVTNMTGEDVWLAGGSYVVPDEVTDGYALVDAYMPLDPDVLYEYEPASPVHLLASGESEEGEMAFARPFEVSVQMMNAPAMIVDLDSTRMCVGYVLASDLPEGVPEKGLLNGSPDVYALSDQTGFELQHVSCSESVALD